MKFLSNYKRLSILTLLTSLTMSPLLTSCGSSGGDTTTAGIGGTGITQGKITGFGSIFVNGVKFDTNQSQFIVDGDDTLSEDDLSIGMIVRITGSVSSDGLTGTAENVEYDDEIQGPVAGIVAAVDGQRTFSVFDKTITIDETTTSFDVTDFDQIADGDIVEVSGFNTSASAIEATFVKKTGDINGGDTEVEIKGTISNLMTNSFVLAGITINFDGQTEIEVPGGMLSEGLFVEVEGDFVNPTTIDAKHIEFEDDEFEDGTEISLQGVISVFNDISDFTINGQVIDASNASLSLGNATLDVGLNVEVEGEIVSGILIADEVELREGEVEVKAFVFDKNLSSNQIEFRFPPNTGSIFVTTDNQTEFEDETGGSGTFALDQVMPGDFIKIEGIDTGSQIIASQVKRLDQVEDTEVQGEVEFFTGTTSIDSITLFGVTFDVDNVLVPGISVGSIVEIKDENPADGTIDEIELEN